MSQWREDSNGKYKRVHKRQWRRRACMVYYYKTLWNYEYGPFGAEVYTAKPKDEFQYVVSYQSAAICRFISIGRWRKEEEEEWKIKV